MDPDANLKEQREIIARMNTRIAAKVGNGEFHNVFQLNEQIEDGERLAELAQALDEWLSYGGFLPHDWRRLDGVR